MRQGDSTCLSPDDVSSGAWAWPARRSVSAFRRSRPCSTTNGTAYAAKTAKAVSPRFVFWFNGNGISGALLDSRARSAPDYELTPCLAPLESLRDDIHVISGIDNAGARSIGTGQRPSQVDERRWCPARLTPAAAPAARPSIR